VQEGPPTEGAKVQPRARFGRREQIAAAVAAALVLLVAVVFWPRHPKAKVAVAPPVAAAPVPAAIVAPPPPPVPLPPARPGSLRVVTHPHGATLTIDGRRMATPSNTVVGDLAAGDHVLVVEKHGHESAERRFSISSGGETKLTVELRQNAAPAAPSTAEMTGEGVVAITSSPWCKVEVDGHDRGQTPLRLPLAAGVHKIELSNPEYKIKRQLTVTVHPGETVRKSLEFTR